MGCMGCMGISRGEKGKPKGPHWVALISSCYGRNLLRPEYREGGGYNCRQSKLKEMRMSLQSPDRRERNYTTTFKYMEMISMSDSFSFGSENVKNRSETPP